MVKPDRVNDATAVQLSRDIVKRIEAELEYPGQIKVTVIADTGCDMRNKTRLLPGFVFGRSRWGGRQYGA